MIQKYVHMHTTYMYSGVYVYQHIVNTLDYIDTHIPMLHSAMPFIDHFIYKHKFRSTQQSKPTI